MEIKNLVLINGDNIVANVIEDNDDYLLVNNCVEFKLGNLDPNGDGLDTLHPFPYPTHSDISESNKILKSHIIVNAKVNKQAENIVNNFITQFTYRIDE